MTKNKGFIKRGKSKTPGVADLSKMIESEVKNGVVTQVEVEKIRPHPLNPRTTFDEDEIRELAETLQSEGQLRPLLVIQDGDNYILLAGERRWRAAQYMGWHDIDVVVRECPNLHEQMRLIMADNVHKELTYVERAHLIKNLKDKENWDERFIAELPLVGNIQTVKDSLMFFEFPRAIKEAAKESKTFGTRIARVVQQILKHGDAAMRKAAKLIRNNAKLSAFEQLLLQLESASDKPRRKNAPKPVYMFDDKVFGVVKQTHKGAKLEIECAPEIIEALTESMQQFIQSKETDIRKWLEQSNKKK